MAIDHAAFEQEQNRFFHYTFEADFEKASCIFGKDHKSLPLFTKGTMEVVRCECGFVYNKRQPTQELLSKFYRDSRPMKTWSEHKQAKEEDTKQKSKYQRAVNFLTERGSVKSVFDLGCGTGRFLSMLPSSWKRRGCDMNSDSMAVARSYGLDVRLGSSLPVGEKFDAITLWGVFEHVKDPIGLAFRCYESLNPGGYLVVCVPNVESFVVHTIWDKCSTFCPQHLWYFDRSHLQLATQRAGFKFLEDYTIEAEARPVARFKVGLPPYGPDIPEPWHSKVTIAQAFIKESVENTDSGYKIVGIYYK